jgi:GT2 family glycosyltransferase
VNSRFTRERWLQTGMTPTGALAAAWAALEQHQPEDARWLLHRAAQEDPALAATARLLQRRLADSSAHTPVNEETATAPGRLSRSGGTLLIEGVASNPSVTLELEVDGQFRQLTHESRAAGAAFRLSIDLPPDATLARACMGGVPLAGSPLIIRMGPEQCPPAVRAPQESPFLWVLVPVYGAFRAVQRCLNSVFASQNRVPLKVLVVDDASTETDLRGWLQAKAQAGEITLLRRPINGGYVAAVNTGLRAIGARDVVILNSDTVVTDHWADRLVRVAASAPDIGAVNPLSNHAELLSVPKPMQANPMPDLITQRVICLQLSKRCHGQAAEIPAAVGFCWYLKGDALAAVGLLDETLTERGYGEDTEYSLRLQRHGWRSVVALDSYVAHEGAQSFRDSRRTLAAQNLRLISQLFPEHELAYQAFLAARPFEGTFHELQQAALADGAARGARLLLGDEVTLRRQEQFATEPFWLLAPFWRNGRLQEIRLYARGVPVIAEIRWQWPRDATTMIEALASAGFAVLCRLTYADWPATLMDLLAPLPGRREAQLVDASGYCPRRHAARTPHRHCEEPDAVEDCMACVAHHGALQRGTGSLATWREAVREDLAHSQQIEAASPALATRLSARFGQNIHAPHTTCTQVLPKRLGFLQVADPAGLALVESLAKVVTARGLPLRLILLGDSAALAGLANHPCVELPGPFDAKEAEHLLDVLQIDALGEPALSEDGHICTLARSCSKAYFDRAALEHLRATLEARAA